MNFPIFETIDFKNSFVLRINRLRGRKVVRHVVRPLYSDPQNPGFLHRRHARCHFFPRVSFLTIGFLKRYKKRRRVVGTCIANAAMLRLTAQLFLVAENDHFEGRVDLKMDQRKYRMEHRNVGSGSKISEQKLLLFFVHFSS